jgi:hypothetical protein
MPPYLLTPVRNLLVHCLTEPIAVFQERRGRGQGGGSAGREEDRIHSESRNHPVGTGALVNMLTVRRQGQDPVCLPSGD